MFYKCSSHKEIDLYSLENTNEIVGMSNVFYGCNSLEQINLSSFNTNCVKYMNKMFSGFQTH